MRITILWLAAVLAASCKNPTAQKNGDWAFVPFSKVDSVNPILKPDPALTFDDPVWNDKVAWAAGNVFNPASVVRHDTLFLLYRAQDQLGKPSGTSRIGLAWSTDGLHFNKFGQPVLYPAHDLYLGLEWEGGCEDPRIVEDDKGAYYMTYTAFDGTNARLLMATSTDLYHWDKKGSVFAKAYNGKYANFWSKSGSIVSTYKDGKVVATKVNGKYWMYWGDQNIWAATSDDLVNWTPVLHAAGEKPDDNLRSLALRAPELKAVVVPRRKKFDSDLVESGPPAMLTDDGIVLIYNGRNIPSIGDPSLPEGTYAAGQVLIDKQDPTKVIRRLDQYFFAPDKPYEITGQVNHVCFLEGLGNYKGDWFLYYGTADSKIAVAEKQ